MTNESARGTDPTGIVDSVHNIRETSEVAFYFLLASIVVALLATILDSRSLLSDASMMAGIALVQLQIDNHHETQLMDMVRNNGGFDDEDVEEA